MADGASDNIDLTGLVHGHESFASLKDQALFATASVIDYGSGIEWADGTDYSSDSLSFLAERQREMTGEDLRSWQSAMGLSINETADIFGVAVSTVKEYRKSDHIPIAWQIACHAMKEDREAFYARYRPRTTGRPRKAG